MAKIVQSIRRAVGRALRDLIDADEDRRREARAYGAEAETLQREDVMRTLESARTITRAEATEMGEMLGSAKSPEMDVAAAIVVYAIHGRDVYAEDVMAALEALSAMTPEVREYLDRCLLRRGGPDRARDPRSPPSP